MLVIITEMKKFILFTKLLLVFNLLSAQTDYCSYSFFVAGHTYGKPGVNNIGLHPPFKQKFEYIQNRTEIKFGVFTGDIVSPNPVSQDWDEVDVDIDSLGLPIYFAAGNHDMENRPLFESRYGDTYYHFTYQNDLFIVLDPNIDEWNISGAQLEFLENVVDSNYQSVDNIFVFFHQLLWWNNDNIYSELRPNSFAGRADTINFWTDIEPIFNQLPNKVVFFAGDMGAAYWSDDFMYDSYNNIDFVCSGMGENIGDNFIVINVDSSKIFNYDLICLNDSVLNCFGELTDYQISSSNIVIQPNIIKLYPNPATDYITIELDKNHKTTTIQLLNINGQLIIEKQLYNTYKQNINLTNQKKGIYLIRVINDLYQKTMKIVIQ